MRTRWAAATFSGAVDAPAAGSGQGPALSRRRGALSALAIIAQDRQRGLSAAGRPLRPGYSPPLMSTFSLPACSASRRVPRDGRPIAPHRAQR